MQNYLIRSYSPIGIYPIEPFIHENAALFISDDIVFSIVKKNINQINESTYWLLPEEIQLCSSISLSIPPMNCGKTLFYPNMPCFKISLKRNTIIKEILYTMLLPFIKEKIENRKGFSFDYSILPKFISNMNYQFNVNAKNKKRQLQLFNAIDIDNKILIRGLDTLLKGKALFCHPQFFIEACSLLHISMEASYHLVCDKAGINDLKPKIKVKKAQEFLCEVFGENYEGQKYFEPYYEDRIKIVHPKNRFGFFSQPEIALDDFYDLYENLIDLYSYLIIGYKNLLWESNWDY